MKVHQIAILVMVITASFSACSKSQSEEDVWQQASQFEKESKFDEAIHGYEKLVRQFSDGKYAEEALQREAFLYYNNIKDFYKTIECHERLVEDYPESQFAAQASFMVGYVYANDLKEYEKAEAAYNQFLELYPESELGESVKWELEHLGQDVNEQLINLFGKEESNGSVKSN